MSKNLKNISVVASLTMVSRVLGLIRDILSANILGGGVFNSAFVTAYNLPNLFRRLLGEGALSAAFVPTLHAELRERGKEGAFALLNNVVSWVAVTTSVLVVVTMSVCSQSRHITGQDPKWYLMADLTVILFPYMAFVCVAAALNAALNVMDRFTEPALSPIWLNLAMIASLGGAAWRWSESDLGQVYWLCGGVLVGGLLQMISPTIVLMREGWRPRFDLSISSGVREITRLMAPELFGVAIYQINIFVSRQLSFSIDESSASVFFYANRLMELPIGVFAIAVSTVVYPLISRHAVEGKFAEMADDFRKGLRLILLINIPAAVGLALLAEPIIRLLFEHGRFTAENTRAMVPLLQLFMVAMPFFSVVSMSTRGFYALRETKTPVRIAAVSFVVNIILSLTLKDRLGTSGLVLASTVAIVLQTVLLQRALTLRLPGMNFAPLWKTVGKIVLAALGLFIVVGGCWWLLRREMPGSPVADLIAVCGLIPVGAGIYMVLVMMLRIEGREEIADLVLRKIRKKA
ncbi:murein biosynthesis integral membrane protein MurJ [Nibricoccus aquaticus]|uniref:Probable lipid II flippase MurJ n=1 Tax=Nibricoccus aquaticus TaxID=2576891 RepID=A0A290QFX2_9BACT|nr:murein biosynthesis integral membrane protein MurJ [Nibricoccus aquaticus]ATC66140.1 murein biosynthesis integral membrane protein MurJ [Nibricoccus aquaticus]